MKKFLSIIPFLSAVAICNAQPKLVVKTDSDSKEIRYWASDGKQLPFYTLAEFVHPDTEGITEILLPQKECLYNVLIGRKAFKIYLLTNGTDTIRLYNDSLSFAGDNKLYNDYLAQMEQSDTYCRDYSRTRNHALRGINKFADFKHVIDSLKANDYLLLRNGKFSKSFICQQELFTEMRYNAFFLMKLTSLFRTPNLTDEWTNELKNRDFLFADESARQSEWFSRSLKDYVLLKSILLEEKNLQDIRTAFNPFLFDSYIRTLRGDNLEYALACFLYDDIFQEEYSKDIPSLYSQFVSLFPNSSYMDVLTPGISKTEAMYGSQEVDSRINIVSYEAVPKTFEDIMRPFAGKVVYIDIWATWCAPCLKMFSHLDHLKEKTDDSKEIAFFYISLDQDRDHEKWKKMTNYYGLYGYHYRVNKETAKIIYSTLGNSGGMLSIPRYVIVDKSGKIAFANAASPSEAEEVIKQLKTLIK